MALGYLTLRFRLPGCRSLKEKRQRLSGIRQRFGRHAHVAVCESAWQDDHKQAEWSFVVLGSDAGFVEKAIHAIEENIENTVDAELVDVFVEME